MTTAAAQAPARVPTPPSRPKPSRTSSLPSESISTSKPRASQASAPTERSVSPQKEGGAARRAARTATPDPLSDKATTFLIRRILCPQHPDKGRGSPAPIEDLLPPLTSRNDVDLQLYALIAIILREYVQNWYTKITPDETFVAEIVQIIAHITRALEQRLRKVDLESLLFDELPDLLDKHVTAYRAAHDPITQPPIRTDPREIYHSLCPLPALSPVPRPEDPESITTQAESEAAYRQLLVQAVLAVLLPTEDLENSCLTALVGQIFSELIIGNAVANRLSEPWLLWELLIIASRTLTRRRAAEDENTSGRAGSASPGTRSVFSVQALFWTILQWCFLATSFIRTTFAILAVSRSLPPRASRGVGHDVRRKEGTTSPTSASKTDPQLSNTPVLAFGCWRAVSNLVEADARMPWLCGALSMLQWIAVTGPGQIAAADGKLDRLLSYGIHTFLLDAANLPPLLRSVRGALFPNNTAANNRKPALVPPSSDAELRALKRRCASSLLGLVPRGVGSVFCGGGTAGGGRGGYGGVGHLLLLLLPSRLRGVRAVSRASRRASPDSTVQESGRREGSASLIKLRADDDRDPSMNTAKLPGGPDHMEEKGKEEPGKTAGLAGSSGSGSGRSGRSAPATAPPPPSPPPLPPPPSSSFSSSSGLNDDKGRDRDRGRGPVDLTVANTVNASAGKASGAADQEADEEEEMILDEIERSVLDVFGDAYCNRHLVYAMLELVLVRLVPELAEKGVIELLGERIPLSPPPAAGVDF
ncbi:PXA domain-containing protein [Madurella fahalii]|uniref:PXA domain-containing protein n=1 Tax=Madurella fahalii TaxID=1157608 RepID=A0ABQ0GS15_9PEZI